MNRAASKSNFLSIKLWLASVIVAATAGLITMMAVPSSAKNPGADHQGQDDRQRLVGSWFVTARVNVLGQPVVTLRTLATCNADGTVVATPQIDIVASTAHGAWRRIGEDEFAITAVYLKRDATGVEFIGTTKVRATLTLHEATQELTGRFQADVFDVDGNVVQSFTGIAQATRIEVEPLE